MYVLKNVDAKNLSRIGQDQVDELLKGKNVSLSVNKQKRNIL